MTLFKIEKKELNELNKKLAQYVYRVRHLENQNYALLSQLKQVKLNFQSELKKNLPINDYELTIRDARLKINNLAYLKVCAQVRENRNVS